MFKLENKVSSKLINFLRENEIIGKSETLLSAEKPGESNMNQVVRIITDRKSIILKQSRDYVNKYPQIEAPIERILVEDEFYKIISVNNYLVSKMPKILGVYPENYLLVLEDLGQNSDFTEIYQNGNMINVRNIIELVNYLNNLHSVRIKHFPNNNKLKKLNHFHIFDFPFQPNNNFNLDEIQIGLHEISFEYRNNEWLKSKIENLGAKYLRTSATLIHGDFYPGSWLKTESGIKIIDPEFSYLGLAEFDLGVLIAHLYMAKRGLFVKKVFENYKNKINENLVYSFAGIEIMRRILGVAQLPLSLSLAEKKVLLKKAKSFILAHDMAKHK